MAVTAIWDVKGRVDKLVSYATNPSKTTAGDLQYAADFHAIKSVVEYSADEMKTERCCYVTGINCAPAEAAHQFTMTKKHWDKEGGIVAFHGYQSFRAGEVDADTAHQIGVALAKELWGDRFEVVVATHLNTDHYHNHFVINSVSLVDGYRYYDNKKSYQRMRDVSDRLCKEHQLSVIKNLGGKGMSYGEWSAKENGKPTYRDLVKADIDRAILASTTMRDFYRVMEQMGYTFKRYRENGQPLVHPVAMPPGAKKGVRMDRLGEAYTFDGITERILRNMRKRIPFPEAEKHRVGRYRYRGNFRKSRKATGLRALYFYYCYRLKIIKKYPASVKRVPVSLREDRIHEEGGINPYMLKSIKKLLVQEKEAYRIPRKVQDLIPIDCIWKDGIFRSGNKYSKSYRFTDINYQVASPDDKKRMFFDYSAILNGLDAGGSTKITINNHRMNRWDFEESVLMPMKGDAQDEYRQEHNDMLLDKTVGSNGIMQEKYVTISVVKKNIQEARLYFSRVGPELSTRFAALGSRCTEVDTDERLRTLHNFFRPGESDIFQFDMSDAMRRGHDFRDYICPDYMEKHGDHLKIGDRYARVLYLKDLASFVKDDMIDELTSLNKDMMLSIDIIPIPTDEAVREVENRLLGVETNITNWQRRQNKNNNFSAVIPYDMELQRKEAKEFLDDLTTRDQRMMLAVITMVITAKNKEELDNETEALKNIAQNRMCQIATLNYQQMDALKTVLPIGPRKIHAFRTLTTESLAVFMPFKVQEIQDKGGMYYGQNAISNNLILCNKANLLNQSSILLGVPGAGKSFLTKQQITNLLLSTDDEILICDPENEYGALVKALCPDAAIISLEAGGKDRLNAMYMVDGYGESDPIVVKSQFIMSLIEQIDKKGVGPQHKSIIDRCVASIYKEAKDIGYMPTLSTLRLKLLEQPEAQAKEIALALELFTTGSLDIFGHGSNVDLEKRVTVFDIRGLGTQLKPTGLLVITDTMLNRVTLNWKRGKRTHVFIDEFHVVFENEFSAAFFNSAWRQFRKRNAYPTAITQNVEYLLDSVQASTMLSNSEFVVMLNQAASDREKLGKLLNISSEQMSFITNAEAGCGLIKYGSALVPFVNRFPKNTKLYELMTTKPGEGVFAKGQVS